MSRKIFLLSLVLLAFLALLLSAMNRTPIELELAFVRLTVPLGLALVVALVVGSFAGIMVRSYWIAQLLNERGRLRRALRLAQAGGRSASAAGDDAG